jgi:hypothetical protein
MPVIGNQELYTPAGVLPFALIKPTAPADQPTAPDVFNDELAAIQSAFGNLISLPVATANTVLTAASRNALVDLSGLINSETAIAITLPENPNVGDPPCIIAVQKSGYHNSGILLESVVVITTSDGTPVNGLTQDLTNFDQITLWNSGDFARCVYIGGTVGWKVFTRLSTVCNPSGGLNLPALGAFPCPGLDYFFDSLTDITPFLQQFNTIGQRFSFTFTNSSVSLGDATYFFNGVAGPYVIVADASYKRLRFVYQGNNAFTVTP